MAGRAAQLVSMRGGSPFASLRLKVSTLGNLPCQPTNRCKLSTFFTARTFQLPELPYSYNALEPHISANTLKFHHDKHHAAYVKKLNELIKGTEFERQTLEEIIRRSHGGIFNNAAQAWNHTFYWNSMKPDGGGEPTGLVKEEIDKSFSSFAEFKQSFSEAAITRFGSGWAWLVRCNQKRKLEVCQTHDAGNPLTEGKYPILTCDVWEHAYFLDKQNDRAGYVAAWWDVVNWDFANKNLEKAMRGESIDQAMGGGA